MDRHLLLHPFLGIVVVWFEEGVILSLQLLEFISTDLKILLELL